MPFVTLGLLGIALTLAVLAIWCAIGTGLHAIGRRHRIPAAPDNQPGTDPADLWTCRRIDALPTASRKEETR
jgi:hypothetical protein